MVDVLLGQRAAEIRHFQLVLGHRDRHLAALGVLIHKKSSGRNVSRGQITAGICTRLICKAHTIMRGSKT